MRIRQLISIIKWETVIDIIPLLLVFLSGTKSLLLITGSITLLLSRVFEEVKFKHYLIPAMILIYSVCGIGSLFLDGWSLLESCIMIFIVARIVEVIEEITMLLLK